MSGIRVGFAAFFVLGAITAAPARAALVRVDFTGIVASVGASLAGGAIEVDDDVIGALVYDTTVSDSDPTVDSGSFANAVTSYDLTVGAWIGSAGAPGNIALLNDGLSGTTPIDRFLSGATMSGPTVGGLAPGLARLAFLSTNTDILSTGDSLPDAPTLNGFLPSDGISGLNFFLFGSGAFPDEQVRYNITSFSAQTVPEPSTVLLLLGGLAALTVARPSAGPRGSRRRS